MLRRVPCYGCAFCVSLREILYMCSSWYNNWVKWRYSRIITGSVTDRTCRKCNVLRTSPNLLVHIFAVPVARMYVASRLFFIYRSQSVLKMAMEFTFTVHIKKFNGIILSNASLGKKYSSNSKDKAVPLQAWSGPEGSRKLRFPDFMTTAQYSGKVVTLTHR